MEGCVEKEGWCREIRKVKYSGRNKAEEFLNAALMIEPKGIYYYLWAYIKYDYFKRKFLNTTPNYLDMLNSAEQFQTSEVDKLNLFEILNIENPFEK